MESMTGYGLGKKTLDGLEITVEVRSVNHRYCEVNLHMPDSMMALESDLRRLIKAEINRGKVDVFIHIKTKGSKGDIPKVKEDALKAYLDLIEETSKGAKNYPMPSLIDVLKLPGVLDYDQSLDVDKIKNMVVESLKEALAKLKAMRQEEGENLTKDIEKKLQDLEKRIGLVTEGKDSILKDQKEAYLDRLNTLVKEGLGLDDLDQTRLYTEVAILADKWTVDEEIVRLNSHLDQFRGIMEYKHPVGRKLDFLLQEFNREANTIASKTKSIPMLNQVVQIKAIIEQLREQVQNIE